MGAMSGKHFTIAIWTAIGGFVLGIAFFAAVVVVGIGLFLSQFGFQLLLP